MDRPFTPILLSIIAGIIFSYYIPVNSFIVLSFMFIIVFLSILNFYRNKPNFFNFVLLFFLIGILNINVNRVSQLERYIDKRSDFIGIVHEKEGIDGDISKYVVK